MFLKTEEVKYKNMYGDERTKVVTKLTGGAIGLITVVAVFLFIFMFCFRTVGVGQVGIVTRFGNVTREQGSGILLKMPWPIEHLTKMNVKTQKEQQDATAATHDLQSVTTTIALNYHLTPDTAKKVFTDVGVNYREVVIDPVLQESIKAVTAKYDANELISQRGQVEIALQDIFTKKLTTKGITVDNVSIVNFEFSKAFDNAIEQKQVSQQQAQKAKYDLETANLRAQAQDVQAKTLTEQYLELQAIEKWDGHLPTTYAGNGSGTLFNIPVKK